MALVKLDATHIAIYGADSSDEGALLLLYDLKFGMTMAMEIDIAMPMATAK